jgi:serine/threonine protein kinase
MSLTSEDFLQLAVCCRQIPQLTCSAALEAQCSSFPTNSADAVFDIVRVLGYGSTSTVYLAKRLSSGGSGSQVKDVSPCSSPLSLAPSRRAEESSLVAVKVVALEGRDDAERRRCFAELECLSMCSCFSVLRDHCDYSYPPGITNLRKIQTLVLILDYASSGDLRREVKRRHANENLYFSEQQAALILLQLTMALKYVHEHGIIHRDIKSANIFLCSNGLVKLGDFGMSHIFTNHNSDEGLASSGNCQTSSSGLKTLSDVFCGSPFYVSPEMWLRRPYDVRSDVYSLGVVLYEMLALHRPFEQPTLEELRSAVVTSSVPDGDWDVMEQRYPSLTPLVRGMMRTDPEERMTVDDILAVPVMRWSTSTLLQIALASDAADLAPADRDRIVRGVRRLSYTVVSSHRKIYGTSRFCSKKSSSQQFGHLNSGRRSSMASNVSGSGMLGTSSFVFSAASSNTTSPARQTIGTVFVESPTTSTFASPQLRAQLTDGGLHWDTPAQQQQRIVQAGVVWKDQPGVELKQRYLTLTSQGAKVLSTDNDCGDPLDENGASGAQFAVLISHSAGDERATQRALLDFEDVFPAPLSALSSRSDERVRKWGFVLILRDGKRHLFRCESEDECDRWVANFERALIAQHQS